MKAKRYLLTLALASILFGVSVSAQDFTKGLLYFNDGNFVLAKKYLQRELNGANKDQAYYLLGKNYQNQGIKDSAAIFYKKGIEVNPENAFAYVGLGEIALNNGDAKEAKANFKKAKSISSEKKNPALWMAIYAAYMNQATPDVEEANEYFEKAKSINKNFAGIYITEGDVLLGQKKIGEAATKYETAIYYDKASKEAFLKLGRIYVKSGNYQQSLDAFNNLYALDSTYFPVHKERAEVYYAQDKMDEAAKSYAKFFAASEPSYNDLVRYALILFLNKDYNKSLVIAREAQAINPKSTTVNRVLAYNCYETKEYANGVKVMEQFLADTKPEDVLSYDYEYYARLLAAVGSDSLAIANYEKAMNPKNPKNNLNITREIQKLYEKMKRYDKVVEIYEKFYANAKSVPTTGYFEWAKNYYYAATQNGTAIDTVAKMKYFQHADSLFGILTQLNPDWYVAYLYRARVVCNFDQDNTKGLAKPYYEKVVEFLEPKGERKNELSEAYLYLGFQYYLAKDKEKAISTYKKVLLLDPSNDVAKKAIEGLK